MLCIVEVIPNREMIYCSIVYAANSGLERRELWKELSCHKTIVDKDSWVLMGDFTMTLSPIEHSTNSSVMNSDMQDFRDMVNEIEVDDICSSDFQLTWTKSLKNPSNSMLKKLDTIMINEEFITRYGLAYRVFLPFLISYHSPSVLSIPNSIPKKPKSFRFSNFVADKDEFIKLAKEEWSMDIQVCLMFRLVKKNL
ncbi:RNA-directed DNA polymerase, eukaryota, Reverse transcriptase zinc-binding domain protein [Artemisia annua]|uniref:RNA-directed DNA polymerase, eukaryota, Reverse transcriptase zinc-binding domain protein n=1 Tax=Artemisia annua TaxID=35608 RepID=A0A2U1MXX7_ARTAN|nr:RNA-directed DNA polymerase, eukaryota, Reverse transcriptase zinc-binding domain protein [Artemisia annua]